MTDQFGWALLAISVVIMLASWAKERRVRAGWGEDEPRVANGVQHRRRRRRRREEVRDG
jgi:hypothetical protein